MMNDEDEDMPKTWKYVALMPCVLADGTRLAKGQPVQLTPGAARYPLLVGWIGTPPPAEPKPAARKRTAAKKG